jgi:hypothetical protein
VIQVIVIKQGKTADKETSSKHQKTTILLILFMLYYVLLCCFRIINKRRLKLPQDVLEATNKLLSSIDSIISVLPPILACEFSVRLELDEHSECYIIYNVVKCPV